MVFWNTSPPYSSAGFPNKASAALQHVIYRFIGLSWGKQQELGLGDPKASPGSPCRAEERIVSSLDLSWWIWEDSVNLCSEWSHYFMFVLFCFLRSYDLGCKMESVRSWGNLSIEVHVWQDCRKFAKPFSPKVHNECESLGIFAINLASHIWIVCIFLS